MPQSMATVNVISKLFRLRLWLRKVTDEHQVATSGVLALLCSFGSLLLFRFSFLATDDVQIAMIAAGGYGTNGSQLLRFPNVLIGYLLKALYQFVPSMPWYSIVMVVGYAMAFWALHYVVLHSGKSRSLGLVLMCALEITGTSLFTYTLVAFVCAAAGMLLLCSASTWNEYVAAFLLLSFGSLVRFPGFVVGVGIGAAILMVRLIQTPSRQRIITIGVLCAVLATFFACDAWNSHVYQQNTHDWNALTRQDNNHRAIDYEPVSYDTHQSEVDELGWSENDLDTYYQFIMTDFDTYSVENVGKLSAINSVTEKYELNPVKIVSSMVDEALFGWWDRSKPMFYIIYLALATLMIMNRKSATRRDLLLFFGTMALALGAIAALYVRQRTVIQASAPIFIAGLMYLVTIMCGVSTGTSDRRFFNRQKLVQTTITIVTLLSMAIITCMFGSLLFWAPATPRKDFNTDMSAWLDKHPDAFIVSGDPTWINAYAPVFEVSVPSHFDRGIYAETWSIDGQSWYDFLNRHNVDPEHLLLELAENDQVYYMPMSWTTETKLHLVITFIEEHSGRSVNIEPVQTFDATHRLYKLHYTD